MVRRSTVYVRNRGTHAVRHRRFFWVEAEARQSIERTVAMYGVIFA
jgi:hypothetical protein